MLYSRSKKLCLILVRPLSQMIFFIAKTKYKKSSNIYPFTLSYINSFQDLYSVPILHKSLF